MTNIIITDRNKKVQARNNMLARLIDAVDELNNGNRKPLAELLKFINNVYQNGFVVDTNYDNPIAIFGSHYGQLDDLIVIKEDDNDLIAIFRIKSGDYAGEWRATEIDHYAFQSDEQQQAESDWEQESEKAMNNYYENRAQGYIYDDPRGQ